MTAATRPIDETAARSTMRRTLGLGVAAAIVVSAAVASAGHATPQEDESFPTDPEAARQLYEGWVDDWLDGPVEMLITDEEREIWDELESTEQKREFIGWFWRRRDDDPRTRANPLREEFYKRVATANQRFRGFPRGWKSDRGRVWITLGRPDGMRRELGRGNRDLTVWTYYTQNRSFRARFGELPVYFIETRPGQLDIYDPQFGAHSFPPYLRDAFEIVRESVIVDTTAEFEPRPTREVAVDDEVEGTLTVDVPLEGGAEAGVAGTVIIPVRVSLPDLFFDPSGERLIARLETELELTPSDGGTEATRRRQWTLSMGESELAEHGRTTLVAAIVSAADAGVYDAILGVRDVLSGAAGSWEAEIAVDQDGATVDPIVVGSKSVELQGDDGSTVGVLVPPEPGLGSVVIAAWVRGVTPLVEEVRVSLVQGESEIEVPTTSIRWAGGPAGPLVIDAELEDLDAGTYTLRVIAADGVSGETTITIR